MGAHQGSQLPRNITRYNEPIILSPLPHPAESIPNFLSPLATDGLVAVSAEELGSDLWFHKLPVQEATEFCLTHALSSNVVAFVDPTIGATIRIPFERQTGSFGLSKEQVDFSAEELDLTPSMATVGYNDLSLVYLLTKPVPLDLGQALQTALLGAMSRLFQEIWSRTVDITFDQDRLVRIPGTLQHYGNKVDYVTGALHSYIRYTPAELLHLLDQGGN